MRCDDTTDEEEAPPLRPTQSAKKLDCVAFQRTLTDARVKNVEFSSPLGKSGDQPEQTTYTAEHVHNMERKYKERIAQDQKRITSLEKCIETIHKEFVKNDGLIKQLI